MLPNRARLWSQSIARRSLLGEGTMNPSIAAKSLLGPKVVAKAKRVLKRAGRRRLHRSNPLPALTGLLGGLGGGLFSGAGRVGKRQEAEAQRLLALALKGDKTPHPVTGLTPAQSIELHAQLGWHGFEQALAILHQKQQQEGEEAAARAARQPAAQIGRGLTELGQSPLAQGVAVALARGGRSGYGRGGYRTTYDQFGNPRRIRTAGFQGAGGGAGGLKNLATAGVAIGGLAAGYYIGSELNNALVAEAPNKEEAGVRAALAFKRAREAAAAKKGAPLSPAETASLAAQYRAQLAALGFTPQGQRRRNVVERFFTGQEEG